MIRITTQKTLKLDIAKVQKTLNLKMEQIIKITYLTVFKGVTSKTPVDTGYARASWNINQGKPDPGTQNKADFEGTGGEGKARAENARKLEGFKFDPNKGTIWITNNVPYIIPLENGHSRRGGYMVQRTIPEVRARLKSIALVRDIVGSEE